MTDRFRRLPSLIPILVALWVLSIARLSYAHDIPVEGEEWSKIHLAAGFQMWRVEAATDDGGLQPFNLVGLVLKPHYAFGENMGAHLRAAYGFNSIDLPTADTSVNGWALAAGLDSFFHIGKQVLWYNTVGLGFQQVGASITPEGGTEADQPTTTSFGAYFITSLDVTMFGPVGMWMDWGCQVVGPTSAETEAGDVSAWEINPLGAGGFRLSI